MLRIHWGIVNWSRDYYAGTVCASEADKSWFCCTWLELGAESQYCPGMVSCRG